MDKSKDKTSQLSILVDKKHGTYYCVDSNGKSYIKNNNQFSGTEKNLKEQR